MTTVDRPVCGQRAVLSRGDNVTALRGGFLSGVCVEPLGHDGPHCSEDGTEWEATR